MDWQKINDLLWNSFCEMSEEEQIHFAENSYSEGVIIFPTAKFTEFCKDTLKGDVLAIAEAVANGARVDDFDLHFPWCMYDPIFKQFATDESPVDLVAYPETVIEQLGTNKDILAKLGFSKKDIAKIVSHYAAEV